MSPNPRFKASTALQVGLHCVRALCNLGPKTSARSADPPRAVIALVFSLAAFASSLAGAASAPVAANSKVDPAVLSALAEKSDAKATVWIQLSDQADLSAAARIEDWNARGQAVYDQLRRTADRSQPAVLARIESARSSGQASLVKTFWISNLIMLRADRATILEIANAPEVGRILPSFKLDPPTLVLEENRSAPTAVAWGVAKIRAPEVWAPPYSSTGVGVVVANVDTGVQFSHPALVNQYRGNIGAGNFNHNYNWFDPTGVNPAPVAVEGSHGTHVMGTEVGSDGGANEIGVAPGARWIAAYGCCPSNEALLEAQQFMLAPTDLNGNNPDPSRRPHVLNQSWGGPGGSEIFEGVVASLRASGIFPAFAAGNNGSAGCGSLGSPGDNPSSFSVASTGTTDAISSSSSRGPNPITGRIGPEVAAPGVGIISSVPGGGYGSSSGTSMASPHVAGAVALLISLEPKLTGQIEQIEELLRKTALPLSSATQSCGGVPTGQMPNNVFGWGRLDVKAAADMVYQAGYLQGTVTVGGVPKGNALVSFTRLGDTLTARTDASGFYKVVAGAGSYALSASFEGQSVNVPAAVVNQNATTNQDLAIAPVAPLAVSGVITEVGTGTPIPAMLLVANQDNLAPVFATAAGTYAIPVPASGGSLVVSHPGYQTLTQAISVGGTQNLQLTPTANYQCLDDTQPSGPVHVWNDASSGTAFPLGDDASSAAVTLPGTFTYYGNDFTTVRINSNGFLYFGATTFNTAHMYLPFEGQPNNDVMALGEDLNPSGGTQGTIYARTVGSQLVVQYHQVQHWLNGFPETFQIILDTATDQITYHYNTLNAPDFTSVGVENSSGSVGQLYSFRNSANLVAGRSVQFTPATGNAVNWGCDHALTLTVADDSDPVPSGANITYRLHWNMTGFGGAPNATLTAQVPANTQFVSASGGIVPVGGTLTWNLGNLRPKAQGSASFTVTATGGPLINTSATISDAAGESRTTTHSTAVTGGLPPLLIDGFEGL